ncbi:hypothetical protein EVAR_16375_1 [Eumeta japonica]|uniref:Uncharacterized protein n=1 Tax=Eumeta variegata TaxID=151549 RepID=A0A4C1VVP7_EUMVA|nr:hypothetical protein EVAR_16375_1 [Eumeta japonica]
MLYNRHKCVLGPRLTSANGGRGRRSDTTNPLHAAILLRRVAVMDTPHRQLFTKTRMLPSPTVAKVLRAFSNTCICCCTDLSSRARRASLRSSHTSAAPDRQVNTDRKRARTALRSKPQARAESKMRVKLVSDSSTKREPDLRMVLIEIEIDVGIGTIT